MPSRHPERRFTDIIDNIDAIESHARGLDQAAFMHNRLVIDAVERCLSRLSEAAVKLGETAERLAPEVPWRDIRGLGNRLRHAYDRIEPIEIWSIMANDLTALRGACDRALGQLPHEQNDDE